MEVFRMKKFNGTKKDGTRRRRMAVGAMMTFAMTARLAVPVVYANQVGNVDAPQYGDPAPVVRRSTGEMTITGGGRADGPTHGQGMPWDAYSYYNFMDRIYRPNVIGDDLDHHDVLGRNITFWDYNDGSWRYGRWNEDETAFIEWSPGGYWPGINVWGNVVDEGEIVYHIDIHWGNMKFVYNFGSGAGWDSDLLTSAGTGGIGSGWSLGPADAGSNIEPNEIRVTNRSNTAIALDFGFSIGHSDNGWDWNVFNDDTWGFTNPTAVEGNFFHTATQAELALAIDETWDNQELLDLMSAGQDDGFFTSESSEWGGESWFGSANTVFLPSAAQFATGTGIPNAALTASRFFAFSGVPDLDRVDTFTGFTNVGRIMIGG
jgi:hypothetical protein